MDEVPRQWGAKYKNKLSFFLLLDLSFRICLEVQVFDIIFILPCK